MISPPLIGFRSFCFRNSFTVRSRLTASVSNRDFASASSGDIPVNWNTYRFDHPASRITRLKSDSHPDRISCNPRSFENFCFASTFSFRTFWACPYRKPASARSNPMTDAIRDPVNSMYFMYSISCALFRKSSTFTSLLKIGNRHRPAGPR